MNADPWLERWLYLLRERAGGALKGDDTAILVEAGFHVVAVDRSPSAIERARVAVPRAEFHAGDFRVSFPAIGSVVGVIIASLSLHYFALDETGALIERIRTTLRPGGALLCRLNSTNDHNYGASGYPRIEDNYYLVNGEPKRFFDRISVEGLFATGWRMLSLEERVIARYAKPKVAWEAVLERDA